MEWPTQRCEDALVFVDFMNVYLARYDTFQGPCYNIHTLLRACLDLGRSIARDPLVVVYLDLDTFDVKNPGDWPKLRRSCEELDIYIVDVMSDCGADQVDPAIIEDMLRMNEELKTDIPFVLISADKGFMPAVTEVRKKREMYIGLPINGCISALARASDGWRWIHPTGWDAMAMKHILYLDGAREGRVARYLRACTRIYLLLSRLKPGQRGRSWSELFPRESSRDPAYLLMEDERRFYLDAFVYYGVLAESFLGYRVLDHHLVGRPMPAS
jgi:hypothetical protein